MTGVEASAAATRGRQVRPPTTRSCRISSNTRVVRLISWNIDSSPWLAHFDDDALKPSEE